MQKVPYRRRNGGGGGNKHPCRRDGGWDWPRGGGSLSIYISEYGDVRHYRYSFQSCHYRIRYVFQH